MKNKNLLILLLVIALVIPLTIITSSQPQSVKSRAQAGRVDAIKSINSIYADAAPFMDEFNGTSLDTTNWTISNWNGLGSIANNHEGSFIPEHVSVANGYLVLTLTQENGQVGTNANGVISKGGEIASTTKFGYGTYEWRARMSSTAESPTDTTGDVTSGQVSGLFNFVGDSETELDFEVEGQKPNDLQVTTWKTTANHEETTANITNMATAFHTYKYIWEQGKVQYFIDDQAVATHTTNVPTSPASIMVNHWGTNSTEIGGTATVGTARYLLVDWVKFTPEGISPTPTMQQEPTNITPTLYCLGTTCPTEPVQQSPTPTQAPTDIPTATPTAASVSAVPSLSPTEEVTPTSGSAEPSPTIDPCASDSLNTVLHYKHHKKHHGGFIEAFFRFFFMLIELFLRLIGVQPPSGPAPTPTPTLEPTAEPTEEPTEVPVTATPEPTIDPCATPTEEPTPTEDPSASPSAEPTTDATPTEVANPTLGLYLTPTEDLTPTPTLTVAPTQ